MWRKFLAKNQGPFLIPPFFKNITVKSQTKQNFEISLQKPMKKWCYVNSNGDFIRNALYYEISNELNRYPSILTSFIEKQNHNWIVATKSGPAVLRIVPEIDIEPDKMTRIRASLLGSVLVFKSFDMRDTSPWLIYDIQKSLKSQNLPVNPPNTITKEQQIVFYLLLENEKKNRIPVPEQQIKQILNKEGASLINLKETSKGYSLSFEYKGTIRNISIKENLMLLNSGMCLDGHDKEFSLDSFLSILYHRGTRGWKDDRLYL